MFSNRKRRRAKKVDPGDGHALQPYRWWQPFTRALFHARIADGQGAKQTYSVDVRLWGDSNGDVKARLYRDGFHTAESKLPAALPVPGGVIEVVASTYGLKRLHLVTDGGAERQLTPDPSSAEGWRAWLDRKHPTASRVIGLASILVLVVALVLGIPQIIEQITSIPFVSDYVGTFTSPIHLPGWLNVTLLIGAIVASTERALRLRYNWLLDGGLFDGDD